MGREFVDFRPWLAKICERFGDVQMIPILAAAEYCGIDVRTLRSDKTFPAKKVGGRYYVPVVALARWLSCFN